MIRRLLILSGLLALLVGVGAAKAHPHVWVAVRSEVGKGSCFYFELTLEVAAPGELGSDAAQRGLKVRLFERERFPRFHIGESLIPETYWVLQRLNMLPKMQASRFVKKYSVQFVNSRGKESAPFYFWDNKPHECSQTWQVVRSEFDQLMLEMVQPDPATMQQIVMSLATKGWSLYRDMPVMYSSESWGGQLYFGTTDGRVCVNTDYLDNVREIERRIDAPPTNLADLPKGVVRPTRVPETFKEHFRLMADLQILAFQMDVTRVSTFMLANEGSNKSYRFIGVNEGHHDLSHHQNDPERLAKITTINRFHATQFAYLVRKRTLRIRAFEEQFPDALCHIKRR